MKIYSKEEIEDLIAQGKTGEYHLIIHSQDLVKLAHAIAYNAQSGPPNSLAVLSDSWRMAIDKHLVKVFGTFLKQEKILILKSRDEDA